MNLTPDKITLNIDGDAKVSIKGFIAPIEYTQSNYHVEYEWDELAKLRVAAPEKAYSASVFRAFLPDEGVSVGNPWQIKEAGALELLRQLHSTPYLDMRGYGNPGLWACLRAYTDKFADIVFRVHAEFQLGDGWFTPSQFTGHLIINRSKESVSFFQMRVPEGPVNFQVSWEDERSWDDSNWIADTGFCAQMELRAGAEDILQDTITRLDSEMSDSIAITQAEAERALNCQFYKSEHIDWVSMEAALELAQAQQKPIHVISIDGPLADEVC
ncbi:hypothetical protein J4G07_12140 [Candidatus Poribacteria bacterium]|nr:hypothetical protein [Candidatus Poribacteria bacterium]